MGKTFRRSIVDNPGDASYDEGVLRWMSHALTEGISFNRSQYNYDKIGQSIDAIMGIDEPTIRSPKLSNARINKLQKIALELRSMLTDIKPFWVYNSNSERYDKQADIFGKLAKNWYQRRGIDQVFRDAMDYVLAAGTGYIHLFFNPELPGPPDKYNSPTAGDIDARAEDPRDVIPIRFSNGDKRTLQGCRGAIIRRERPTSWYKQVYKDSPNVDKIQVDRMGLEKESPSQRRAREAQEAISSQEGDFQGTLFGAAPIARIGGAIPVTDEFTAYIHDYSINNTSQTKLMGPWEKENGQDVPASKWSYKVAPGDRYYPFGRRIIFTRWGVLEDGPGHFHHGMIPICKVTLDSWAWSFMGTSPIHPLLSLQRALDENVRAVQDHIRRSSKRGIIYDKKAVPPPIARKLNTRLEGQKLGINPHAAGPKGAVQIIEEPPLDQAVPEWMKLLFDSMDEMAGIANLRDLSKLNQVPSADTIEQLTQAMTPLVKSRSMAMEVFVRDFAMMLASMFMQFYDLEFRLRILGGDGSTYEDFDFRPGDLMPDYVGDDDYENYYDHDSQSIKHRVKQDALDRGSYADHIRNREFLRYFSYDIAPGTLLDYASMSKRLVTLQFARMGLVDHWTLLEEFGVKNVGKPPSWATTITKRLQAERLMGVGIIASTQGRAPTAQAAPAMGPHGLTES